MRHAILAATAAAGAICFALATPAAAAPVITSVGSDFSSTDFTFGFGGATFTLSGTGDIFNPTAISSGGNGQVNSDFLGRPTSYFVDRGTVAFSPDPFLRWASFVAETGIPFSNGNNFIGLRSLNSDGSALYGFVFTTNNIVNSFGFETIADAAITATVDTPVVPEPATWAMMIGGFGLMGGALRHRKARVAYA